MNEFTHRRVDLFLELADKINSSKDMIDHIYDLIIKYDLPSHMDREFVFECLISFYVKIEEYERCAILDKIKVDLTRRDGIKLDMDNLTIDEIIDLKTLGYQIPDALTLKAILNKFEPKSI